MNTTVANQHFANVIGPKKGDVVTRAVTTGGNNHDVSAAVSHEGYVTLVSDVDCYYMWGDDEADTVDPNSTEGNDQCWPLRAFVEKPERAPEGHSRLVVIAESSDGLIRVVPSSAS